MANKKTVAVVGTFDSKGKELMYLKEVLESLGVNTYTIHTGVFDVDYDIDCSNAVLTAAAGEDLKELQEINDRGRSVEALSKGFEIVAPKLYKEGKFDGIIALGGSGGTSLAAPGMRALPIGVPKVIVSTMAASKNGYSYIGESDIILFPSIVDVAGLNSISTEVFTNAAKAVVGMTTLEHSSSHEHKPMIAATMFGNTTPAVNYAREYLEARGYEVLVFHATGSGGKTMEHLIRQGYFKGVLDITTTEWNDELFGGILNAGPHRLEAAGETSTPQVVSVGAMDEINFGAMDTLPEEFRARNLYEHNPTTTLVRTTAEENKVSGAKIAEQLNKTQGPAALVYPLLGNGQLSEKGKPFYDPEADQALLDAIESNLDQSKVELIKLNCHINTKEFGETCAKKLLELMGEPTE